MDMDEIIEATSRDPRRLEEGTQVRMHSEKASDVEDIDRDTDCDKGLRLRCYERTVVWAYLVGPHVCYKQHPTLPRLKGRELLKSNQVMWPDAGHSLLPGRE
jgi:hypothetical protein